MKGMKVHEEKPEPFFMIFTPFTFFMSLRRRECRVQVKVDVHAGVGCADVNQRLTCTHRNVATTSVDPGAGWNTSLPAQMVMRVAAWVHLSVSVSLPAPVL